MEQFAAIDVGGTKIALGIGTADGKVIERRTMHTDPGWSPDEVLDRIADTLQDLMAAAGVEAHGIKRIGLGTPGPLDGPVLLGTSNLHAWQGLNWKTGLESRMNIAVSVENDATAAGVGEWKYGAGRGTPDCIYVTVSTGVGAGIVAAGRWYSGARGNAGEFGHIVMEPGGPVCAAGHRGCLEQLASGTAIRREGQDRQRDSAFLGSLSDVDTKDVFDGYDRNDPVCEEIIGQAADRLALGLSYLINLFNPERIILGGGVGTNAPESYFQRIRGRMKQLALPAMADVVTLERAELGADSGLIGALALAVAESEPSSD